MGLGAVDHRVGANWAFLALTGDGLEVEVGGGIGLQGEVDGGRDCLGNEGWRKHLIGPGVEEVIDAFLPWPGKVNRGGTGAFAG